MSVHGLIGAAASAADDAEFDPDVVSPGVQGFIFTALLAAGIIVLGFLLVSRLRRNSFRHQIQDEIAAELADREGETVGDSAGEGSEGAERSGDLERLDGPELPEDPEHPENPELPDGTGTDRRG